MYLMVSKDLRKESSLLFFLLQTTVVNSFFLFLVKVNYLFFIHIENNTNILLKFISLSWH